MRKLLMAVGVAAAALMAVPAVAQTVELITASGPGVGGAAGTVQVTGKITAINAETREVTITGEGARQMVLTVGPEAKNFSKLVVGDHVDMLIAKALKLELRKGSTAEVSRSDQTEMVDSGVPGKPGGAIGHTVVVMAEVTALDAATQTVTLQGPKKSMDLKIADPEQFKGIAVGDRVEATYVEAVAVEVNPVATSE